MDKLNNLLIQLYVFQNTLDEKLFYQVFPFYTAHLWKKFSLTYKYNLLEFYNNLDAENRELFCDYIIKNLTL